MSKKEEKAIVAANMQMNGTGIEIRTLQDAKLVAETFIASNLVPRHFDSSAKVIVAIQAGFELGFKPWQALNNLHVVNGQVGIKSSAMGGLIRSSGKCKMMKQYYAEDLSEAIIESQRTDDDSIHKTSFSLDDAKVAGLTGKDNWKHYQKDMLMWRALSRHGRQFYGDVLSGFYTVEELQTIPKPEPSHETTTLKRKIVDAEQKDTPDNSILIKTAILGVYEIFERKVGEENASVEKFAVISAMVCGGEKDDYWEYDDEVEPALKPESYTMEKLIKIKDSFVDESETQPEVLDDYKYVCNAKGHRFNEPTDNNLCPECLSKNISKLEEVDAK